jgi:ABC-type amino acid transport substrate-binding protein
VLVLLVALVAAGCGGDDDGGEPAGAGGTQPAALTGLVTDGVLTVGTELPAPPFWIGEDYDSLTGGFEVDLAKEIAKRLNLASGAPATSTSARSPSGRTGPRWSTSPSRSSTATRASWSRRVPRSPAWRTPRTSSGARS